MSLRIGFAPALLALMACGGTRVPQAAPSEAKPLAERLQGSWRGAVPDDDRAWVEALAASRDGAPVAGERAVAVEAMGRLTKGADEGAIEDLLAVQRARLTVSGSHVRWGDGPSSWFKLVRSSDEVAELAVLDHGLERALVVVGTDELSWTWRGETTRYRRIEGAVRR